MKNWEKAATVGFAVIILALVTWVWLTTCMRWGCQW